MYDDTQQGADQLQRDVEGRVAALEEELAALRRGRPVRRGVRKRSEATLFGLPLYDIATGPDPQTGERRGRACGIIAVGDIATGVLAIGGVARGGVCLGGVAIGLVTFGGLSLGLLAALGGLALGGLALGGLAIGGVALGGGAAGYIAAGGGAVGYYACGGAAIGEHVLCPWARDPEAVRLFAPWVPGL